MQNIVSELLHSARRNFPRRKYIVHGRFDLFQADLICFPQFKRENSGHAYILLVLDCFSKKAWARAVKTKSGTNVATALDSIVKEAGRPARLLQTDNGTEFYNTSVRAICAKYNMKLYSVYTHLKAAMVERLIRTIKARLFRIFNLQGSHRWYGRVLKQVMADYNGTKHSATGYKPNDVGKREEEILRRTVFKFRKTAQLFSRFRKDDPVRVSKFRSVFDKPSHGQNWSREVFYIHRVQNTQPITYVLRDNMGDVIRGAFYREELLSTRYPDTYVIEKVLRRNGNRMYVKFYDYAQPEWVKMDDVLTR